MREEAKAEQSVLCYEAFDAFKRGMDVCLMDVDKKHKVQVATLRNLRFPTFKNDQCMEE